MAQVISSKKVTRRNLKIMYWGDYGTRKTEEILRNYPHIFLVDAEGNSDMCVDNPSIPEFLQLKTKDPREAIYYMEKVAAGKIKFDDGSPVETLAIDGWTVFWNVQKEFANSMAEERAEKYKKDGEKANATQLDWGLAKRPMSSMMNLMENSPFKYLVFTSREAPMYDPKNENVKIGERADAVKGTGYEANLSLQFLKGNLGAWSYKVDKVQGTLSDIFPPGTIGTKIPYDKLFAYGQTIKNIAASSKSEDQIAMEQVKEVEQKSAPAKKEADLIAYATEINLDPKLIGKILGGAGFKGFDPNRWDDMTAAMTAAVVVPQEA